MLPVLLDLRLFKIYTFGIFLVLAFFWGSFLLWHLIRLTSFKEEDAFDGLFWGIAGGLFFGRLLYVILNFSTFGFNLLKFILINGYPGLSIYGCVGGGAATIFLYCVSKKIKFSQMIDYFIPPLFLAIGFGKLGSFFSGAEIGEKTKFILAIKYAGFDGLRHLTPLYEALLFFLAVYIAYRFVFEIRKEKLGVSFNFYFMVWYFALVYLLFDKLKFSHLYLGSKSFYEIVSAILFLTLTGFFLYNFRIVIADRFKMIINYFFQHGKKIGKKIHFFPKRNDRDRNKKNTASD